mgnify:CR=1 FL=1
MIFEALKVSALWSNNECLLDELLEQEPIVDGTCKR